ncbi:MAG: MBOAT family protein, partial [Acidaminococcaceae bacterium]|nr:MBOAT family protein [Acidaminococcaceae bacterium]
MSFTSILFYLFAALTLLLYYILLKRAQWIVVMLMSIVFYATYGIEQFPFIILSSLTAYFAARKMQRIYGAESGEDLAVRKRHCKGILALCLPVLIGLLAYTKTQSLIAPLLSDALSNFVHLGDIVSAPALDVLEIASIAGGFIFFPFGASPKGQLGKNARRGQNAGQASKGRGPVFLTLTVMCVSAALLLVRRVFHAPWPGKTLELFVILALLLAYALSLALPRLKRGKHNGSPGWKNAAIVILMVIAALLVPSLYSGILPDAAGGSAGTRLISVLGISYFSFSLISYVADVYWRKDKAETNYFRLLAFTIYFPKILQGPISRHRELAPQMFAEHPFDYRQFCFGIQRMLWGYFKKMVIADRLALFVNTVFGNIAGETGAHLLVAAVFGAVQLYCDFSGCMDIACGFSECLGLQLAENFDHPFFSRGAAEFWRRWHITL